ncbi:hypothetical protein GIW45_27060, partial [Pseudomonas congelans]|uniref:hypothetical protein n=1 Tax=Pseudomonas congelans TaxID=200452 RepID=UPI001F30CB5F
MQDISELHSDDDKHPDRSRRSDANRDSDQRFPLEQIKPIVTASSNVAEIERHEEAVKRYEVLTNYLAGEISAEVAMEILCIKRSRFYKLLKYMEGAKSYRTLVADARGRKPGLTVTDPETLKLIEEMFEEHYPDHKTIAAVWKHCQTQADNRRIIRPSYHTVATWIKAKADSLLYSITHTGEQTKQRFG